jgi:hypothetical protein
VIFITVTACAPVASASPILDAAAPNTLALYTLGSAPGVAAQYSGGYTYQGIALIGDNLLLSVGNPTNSIQTIWSLPVIRASGHITGFASPSVYAQVTAANQNSLGNIVAGGLLVTSQGLLYTTQGYSFLGQYNSSTQTSALLDVTGTGAFTGGLQQLPGGGANQFKISSVTGQWYTVTTSGSPGAYTIGSYTAYNPGISAYSFLYAPAGNALPQASIVLGDAGNQRIDAYAVDANGNPCNCAPVTHLVIDNNFAIGYGLVRDPGTGDLIFTTQNNDFWLLTDDIPEPSTIATFLSGFLLLAARWGRRFRFRLPSHSAARPSGT